MKSLSFGRALPRRARRAGRLALECLEDRCLPSVVGPLLDNQGDLLSNVQYPVNIKGELYFSANDGVHGQELFKSDGTQAGTELVLDIVPGSGDSNPSNLTNLNGTLFFTAFNSTLNLVSIWESTGTAAGTFPVILQAQGPQELLSLGGPLLFLYPSPYVANTEDILAYPTTDLTNPGGGGSVNPNPADFAVAGNLLYFVENVPTTGEAQLWQTDGTYKGTSMAGGDTSFTSISDLVTVGNTLYFTAATAQYGTQLWALDSGTFSATMLTDINPTGGGLNPTDLTNVNGTLFFNGNDGVNGPQLWKSDGTTGGTVPVSKFTLLTSPAGLNPIDLTNVNGTLFFQGTDSTGNPELWKSDGTTAGTVEVATAPGGMNPHLLTNVNGTLFFAGTDGVHGEQLWESDGTSAGTVELTNADASTGGVEPYGLSDVGGTLFTEFANGTFTVPGSPPGLYIVPNTPPVANTAAFTAQENTTLSVSASSGLLAFASPAGYGGPLTLYFVSPPEDGSLKYKADGSFIYTPNTGFVGTDSFTYLVKDGELTSSPATVTITVAPGGLVSMVNNALFATEFQPVSGIVGTFVDLSGNGPAADYTALVNWGDGAITVGTVMPFGNELEVFGTHTYTQFGSFTAEATLFDADGTSAGGIPASVSVADALLLGQGQHLNFVEGVSSPSVIGPNPDVVATFVDTDPTGGNIFDYKTSIDWGDGTSSEGSLTNDGKGFEVDGSHTYTEEHPFITITVTITDSEGAQLVVLSSATVADAPLTAIPVNFKATGGKLFTGEVALFTDADPAGTASDYTATITWDDGSTSTGKITGVPVGRHEFAVTASHIFAPFTGTHHITVQIFDGGGSQVSVTDAVTDPPIPTPNEIYVFATYHALTGQPPAYAALLAWTNWLNQGVLTRSQFVQQVEATPAYRGNIVQGLYQEYLNQPADATALAEGIQFLAHHSAEQLAQQLALPAFDSGTYRMLLLASYTAHLPQAAAASTLKWALAAWQDRWTDNQVLAHVLASDAYWDVVENP